MILEWNIPVNQTFALGFKKDNALRFGDREDGSKIEIGNAW